MRKKLVLLFMFIVLIISGFLISGCGKGSNSNNNNNNQNSSVDIGWPSPPPQAPSALEGQYRHMRYDFNLQKQTCLALCSIQLHYI